jgi:integrase
LFAGPGGRYIDPRFVTDRWHAIRDRAGVGAVPFHGLRHAVASELLRSGVDVRTAADVLGHDPKMLLSTYAHVIDQQRRSAMAGLARSFGLG